ncbi:MAG: sigma-70 family RNA polymerase sigma factor [Anditalea sp.]
MKGEPQNGYSEQEIIQGIKENNEGILTHLVKKLTPKVSHWIKRNGGFKEQAEDIIQDTWMVVLIKIHSGKYEEGNFEAYFMGVSRNIWLKGCRNNPMTKHGDPSEHPIKDLSEEELILKLLKDKRYEIVHQKLMELSEKCRNIIALRYYKDTKLEDIADQMDISVYYAKIKLHRCRNYLSELLKRDPDFTID